MFEFLSLILGVIVILIKLFVKKKKEREREKNRRHTRQFTGVQTALENSIWKALSCILVPKVGTWQPREDIFSPLWAFSLPQASTGTFCSLASYGDRRADPLTPRAPGGPVQTTEHEGGYKWV